MKKMKRDFRLGLEQLDNKVLLSSNPWYIDTIKAPEVWSQISVIHNKPVVAIVDSGVDLNHSALVPNLFRNPLDPVDGKDNDGNGYVDDITGWDFVQNDNSPQDDLWHGTHVAGIVNIIGNNNISILPLKFIGASGSGYMGAASIAIHYAVDLKLKGINVVAINCSFGGVLSSNPGLSSAIQRASDNGIIVVIASGNNGSDLDITPRYPGSLSYANTITVAGTNSDNTLAAYSNYGVKTVAIVAPGTGIYSTLPGNTYGNISGTSMAAPMVSGSVALLKSFGNYAASSLLTAIKSGANTVGGLLDKVTHGLLDLTSSLRILKTQSVIPPPAPPKPIVPPVPVVAKLTHRLSVSNNAIHGWVNVVSGKVSTPVVQVYINNKLRYTVKANLYRGDTKQYNGFYIAINRKYLNLRNNKIEVRLVDSTNSLQSVIFKQYLRK